MICEPAVGTHQSTLLVTGYRLGPDGQYQWIKPDSQGGLLSETTGLLFGVEEDGRTLLVIDTRTGERLLTREEQSLRDRAARKAAEEQIARDIEARKAAEAEIARLRAELEKVQSGTHP